METNDRKDYIESKFEDQAKTYVERYPEHMEMLEGSLVAKAKHGITSHDQVALGKQLEMFETYMRMVEGDVNQLGELPKVAFDVITAVQGSSILPVIAGVQPIEEEKGLVYFKNIKSKDTRGSQTAGDVVVDPKTGVVTPSGYSSGKIEGEDLLDTAGGTTNYTGNLAVFPVKSESLKLTFSNDAEIVAIDVGPQTSDKDLGCLYGKGLSGTIRYSTGAYDIDFEADPGAGHDVFAEYQQNFELSADVPEVEMFMDSKLIEARVYALKGTIGMIQQFVMQKRFGSNEELAKMLVEEINREIGGDLIRKIAADAQGTTTFARTLPSGVSAFEHKQQYKDKLYEAENVMLGNAGRGQIKVMIVGRKHAATVRSLPGFKLLHDGNSMGAHIFGELDGVTYVRVPEANLLGIDRGVGLWKGSAPWEAACVYSPFMPMVVTTLLPTGQNPLNNQKAAAQMAGVDTLVANFATNYNLSGDFA